MKAETIDVKAEAVEKSLLPHPWLSKTSRQVGLLCACARHLMGRPYLYVKDRWPINLGNGNSLASADVPSKILRYNLLSREWRINMDNRRQSFQHS